MVAVLEHLVRGAGIHLDEGLEKEFIIFLFVSSVCSGGTDMDDDNVGLFERLHELIYMFRGVGVTVGRGGDVLRDSLHSKLTNGLQMVCRWVCRTPEG